jgi:hypothetical protein
MDNLTITEQPDELTQIEIRYYYLDKTLWLDSYQKLTRQSKRHKYVVETSYSRLSGRSHKIQDPTTIPGLPDQATVIQKYLEQIANGISVKLWEDRK